VFDVKKKGRIYMYYIISTIETLQMGMLLKIVS